MKLYKSKHREITPFSLLMRALRVVGYFTLIYSITNGAAILIVAELFDILEEI